MKKLKKGVNQIREAVTDKGGEGYVETGVKLIISVVIGSLLLGGLYALFNNILLPQMAEHMQHMFTA